MTYNNMNKIILELLKNNIAINMQYNTTNKQGEY